MPDDCKHDILFLRVPGVVDCLVLAMSFSFGRLSQSAHRTPGFGISEKMQGAGFGPRIGKPVQARRCPRNGNSDTGHNVNHWAGGAREGVVLRPVWATDKPGNQPGTNV